MNGILILVLVTFLSGLIAYLGDRIGMKMGKKRVSLFGLRPRYSSIIITIVTGILIALISVTILLSVYSELRQALFNINDVLYRLEYLNKELAERDSELSSLKSEIEKSQQEINKKNALIEKKDQEIQQKDKEIKASEKELNQLEKQRNELQAKLENLQQELKEANSNLQTAAAEIKELEANRDDLKKRVSELDTQRKGLEEKVADLQEQINNLTANYEELKELAGQLQAGVIYYMGEEMVYQKGDIIYTDVMEGGRSEQETISALNKYLQEANKVAKQKDIEINEETGMALRLQTEDILNAARIIYNMDPGSRVIVSLVARVNVPKNDWLYANFLLNEDFIVFEKNELIVSREIDADQSPDQIEAELEALLDKVNNKAINQGLLPNNSGQVGSINFSYFYEILNKIKSMSGRVEVSIRAAEDIWRVDRLTNNLDFNIKEID